MTLETPTDALRPSHTSTLYPSTQCRFCTEGGKGLIDCLKDYDAKHIVYRMTLDVCGKCWSRIVSRRQEASYRQEPQGSK